MNAFSLEQKINLIDEINTIEKLFDENFNLTIDTSFDNSKYLFETKSNEVGDSQLIGILQLKDDHRKINALVHELYHFYLSAKGLPISLVRVNESGFDREIKNKIDNILQHKITFPLYCNHDLEVNKFMTFEHIDYKTVQNTDLSYWTMEYYRNLFSLPISTGTDLQELSKSINSISDRCSQWNEFLRRKVALDILYNKYDQIKVENYWDFFLKILDVFNLIHPPGYLLWKNGEINVVTMENNY